MTFSDRVWNGERLAGLHLRTRIRREKRMRKLASRQRECTRMLGQKQGRQNPIVNARSMRSKHWKSMEFI
jgi:hypothetical protein